MEAEFHTVILLFWGVDGLIFVTTGQRIAVENFEQGLIYKVVFTDNTAKYMMCTGIGKDFVMLFGQDLFALTMQTAQRVNTIDLYTPIEPVPPPSHLLQYQTGVPPFSFNTSGTNLWSYYIKGNTIQNGTPTPSSPVDVVGVGELETSGEHSGQYKISILCGGTTTPVYLGEVQTTRQINKLVLTGQETGWQNSQASGGRYRFVLPVSGAINADTGNNAAMCTHLPLLPSGGTYSTDNGFTIATEKLYMRLTAEYDTLTAFKAYLQDQYSAGTPVVVYYVLATPQTAAVNEHLMKIGTYADSITSEQSGISITTNVGDNTLSVNTTVQPSEMQIVYEIDLEE